VNKDMADLHLTKQCLDGSKWGMIRVNRRDVSSSIDDEYDFSGAGSPGLTGTKGCKMVCCCCLLMPLFVYVDSRHRAYLHVNGCETETQPDIYRQRMHRHVIYLF